MMAGPGGGYRQMQIDFPAPNDYFDEGAIQKLVDARTAAKKAKNFKEADRIRDELAKQGIVLEDVPGGTRWKRA